MENQKLIKISEFLQEFSHKLNVYDETYLNDNLYIFEDIYNKHLNNDNKLKKLGNKSYRDLILNIYENIKFKFDIQELFERVKGDEDKIITLENLTEYLMNNNFYTSKLIEFVNNDDEFLNLASNFTEDNLKSLHIIYAMISNLNNNMYKSPIDLENLTILLFKYQENYINDIKLQNRYILINFYDITSGKTKNNIFRHFNKNYIININNYLKEDVFNEYSQSSDNANEFNTYYIDLEKITFMFKNYKKNNKIVDGFDYILNTSLLCEICNISGEKEEELRNTLNDIQIFDNEEEYKKNNESCLAYAYNKCTMQNLIINPEYMKSFEQFNEFEDLGVLNYQIAKIIPDYKVILHVKQNSDKKFRPYSVNDFCANSINLASYKNHIFLSYLIKNSFNEDIINYLKTNKLIDNKTNYNNFFTYKLVEYIFIINDFLKGSLLKPIEKIKYNLKDYVYDNFQILQKNFNKEKFTKKFETNYIKYDNYNVFFCDIEAFAYENSQQKEYIITNINESKKQYEKCKIYIPTLIQYKQKINNIENKINNILKIKYGKFDKTTKDFIFNTNDAKYIEAYNKLKNTLEKVNLCDNFTEFLDKIPNESILYFHNCKYDFNVLLNTNPDIKILNYVENNNSFYTAHTEYKKKKIIFKDTYKLISSPLRDFTKMFKLKNVEKLKMNYELFNHAFIYFIKIILGHLNFNDLLFKEIIFNNSYIYENFGDKIKYWTCKLIENINLLKCYRDNYFINIFNENDTSDILSNNDIKNKIKSLQEHRPLYDYCKIQYDIFFNYSIADIDVLHDGFIKFEYMIYELTLKLNEEKKVMPNIKNLNSIISISSLSFIIQKYFDCFEGIKSVNGLLSTYIGKYVKGGVCMTHDNKKYKTNKPYFMVDFTSLYPSSLYHADNYFTNKINLRKSPTIEYFKTIIKKNIPFLIEFEFIESYKIKPYDFQVLLYEQIKEDKDKSYKYVNEIIINKPIKLGKPQFDLYVKNEIINIDKIKINELIIYEKTVNNNVKDLTYNLFELRKKYIKENNNVQLIVKLILNSLYGKLIEKEKKNTISFKSDFNFDIPEYNKVIKLNDNLYKCYKSSDINKHSNYAHIGAYLLSNTKAHFYDALFTFHNIKEKINLKEPAFLYSDTDSMIIHEKIFKELLSENYKTLYGQTILKNLGLGSLIDDLDGKYIKKCIILGKKFYYLECSKFDIKDGNVIKSKKKIEIKNRCKGINRNLIKRKKYIKLYKGEKLKFNLTGGALIKIKNNVVYKLQSFIREVKF